MLDRLFDVMIERGGGGGILINDRDHDATRRPGCHCPFQRLNPHAPRIVAVMDSSGIETAVDVLARGRAAGRLERVRMDLLPSDIRPSDEDEAYALQKALHQRLEGSGHGHVSGHKIGCTTTVMQEYLGIHNPCAGGIFDSTVHEVDGIVGHAGFQHVGVECEIAVRLAKDLPATGAPYDANSVAPAVETVMAAIEIVDDRWLDYPSVDTPTLIADDFFGAGCVLGRPVAGWRSLDLASITGGMSINGESVGTGVGGDILGHPLEALAWLANSKARRGETLASGEFVLLGSIVQTRWVEAGDRVEIEIEGLGEASILFETTGE